MPLDPFSIAAGVGTGLVGNLFNWFSQSNENQKNREWSEKMYEKQLQDQRENWQMMVDYNSPSAQMERLASAGLNPHLVYGSGAVATSNSQPSGASFPSNSQKAPYFDLSQFDMLGKYLQLRSLEQDVRGKELSNDEKEASKPYWNINANNVSEILEKKLGILDNELDIKNFNAIIKKQEYLIRQYIVYYEDAEKPSTMSDVTWNEIQSLGSSPLGQALKAELEIPGMNKQLIQKRIDQISAGLEYLAEQKRYMSAHADIEEFFANLASMGINPHDPLWLRAIVQLLGGKDGVVGLIGKAKDFIW